MIGKKTVRIMNINEIINNQPCDYILITKKRNTTMKERTNCSKSITNYEARNKKMIMHHVIHI